MAETKVELEKRVLELETQLSKAGDLLLKSKETEKELRETLNNLQLLYTRKSTNIMDAVKTLYRHLSLELED